MRKLMLTGVALALPVGATLGGVIYTGESAATRVNSPVPDTVERSLPIYASPWAGAGESVSVSVDGTCLFSTTNQTETQWTWQPLSLGNHTLTCTFGTNVLMKTLNVTALDFYVTPSPNPPMAKDNNVSITPTTRNFGVNGGGNAIITSGSGTWTAVVSDPWITLNTTTGNVGYPVAYTVSANTNVEQRTGYVYVSGWVHTVTQDGVGGTISPENREFEHQGGSGTIAVSAANKMVWQARPNVDWLSVTPTSGAGEGSVTYQVAPYNEVATRQGTLTVAGNTFTVFQYGRRMKLDPATVEYNYETHVIPITVNALDTTQWSVTPNNSWVSVIDAGNGHGGDLVTIAIAENPSYKARTGTVTIGTETFTVTQQGRPTEELEFSIDPESTTASVNGAYGLVAVIATPDLPWVATSGANWLTIYPATANGAGRANVAYNASPNPTLFERTGTIIVTPEAASGMTAKTQTVVQPAAESSLSLGGYEFEAAGGSCSVEVSVANIVQWSADESIDWITVNGSISRTGPGTVVLQAAANGTVYPRSGTVTIAGKSFSVSQRARGVEVEYESMLFGTDGGYESISIHPDGNSDWTAVASDPTWITIFQGDSGTGDGEIMYIVAPYNGDGSARTGWIEVGDKKVYITQRPYELSVSPNGSVVKGNNGTGEFGVSANIGAVWNAIVTEPWIALVSGYDAGTGSGTVRFICEDNNTGRPRVGKIIVAGEEYTVTQSARILVKIQATAGHGGSITGAGTYDKGEKIVLTAVPDSGYQFVRWTGPVSSTDNPLTMEADDLTGIKAEFEPMPVDFTSVVSSLDGVDLEWNTLAWATTYKLFRGETDDIASATELATFLNGAVDAYRDESGDRGVTYWYWVMASGVEGDVVSMPVAGMRKPIVNSPITYQNLRGATHSNPDTYVEGRAVVFSHPSALAGYTFAGWTPERITEDMTGAQTVRAAWAAHEYSIVYDANGGNGMMSATPATYDVEAKVAANGFSRAGHSFVGWATNNTGAVVFTAGQPVTNLTDVAGAKLTFYAVWTVNRYTVTFNANGGTGGKTVTQDYGTALSAPTVTRTGYTFTGWSPAVPSTMPAGNATYVAQWKVNQYTVTFDANGGTGGTTKTQNYGTSLSAPTVTRTGYTFTGWSPAVPTTVPAANATYTAQWKVNQYTVTFDANGGTGGTTKTQNYGTSLTAPTVTRTGYTFTGWSPSVPSTMPARNTTYTAQWQINQYTVTFDANGKIWYVNGASGLDSNSGTSHLSAKATIQAAIDVASDGDAILVAPGTYAPITTGNKAVTIQSTAGAESTIIDGNKKYPCTVLSYSTIVGFTLQNGYVSGTGRGGAGTGGTFRNCIICDNEGDGYGAAGGCVASVVQNCLVCRNRYSDGGWGGGALANCSDVFNCTIVDNFGYGVWDGEQRNCIIYGNTRDVYVSRGYEGHNNYCMTESFIASGVGNKAGNPNFVDAANGDYRLAASSPCIDAGDNSHMAGDADLDGNARIANSAVDIGCYEYGSTATGVSLPTSELIVELVYGTELGKLPELTRTGYTFDGWWTSKTGGVKVTEATRITGDVTYYAHWKRPYTVRYRKYDGSGETAEEDFECGKTYTLAWLGSELGWSRPGYEFIGWVPWNPDTKPRLCKYVNGQPVKDLAAADETINLWAGWKSPSSYRVCFHLNDGTDVKMNQVILRNKEDDLAWMDSQIGWKCPGYSFRGWSEYEGSSTVKYANGATVMNLAMNGGTKHLYAVWELKPDAYVIQYHRYDGSGETREQEMNVGEEKNLLWMDSQLGWSRPGYEFIGWVPWNPDAKARLCKYVNGQKVEDIGEPGELVHLWAAWKSASSYRVCFNRNDGTGVKMNQVILRNKEDNLAWMDSMIGWKCEGYVFKGWAESEKGAVKYANGAKVKNLAMDGGTKHLYAIWRVAD